MKASICMAVYRRAEPLDKVLASIRRQQVPFPYEIVVADDGSPTDDERRVCRRWDVEKYIRLDARPYYSSSVWARNAAYRAAVGDVLILQSSEVLHHHPKAIEVLSTILQPGSFVLGRTWNAFPDPKGIETPIGSRDPIARVRLGQEYIGPVGAACRRPLFFLGAAWRHDVYAIGGNDEDFVYPGYEDNWFADCLTEGRLLTPIWTEEPIGLHQDHERLAGMEVAVQEMGKLYYYKRSRATRGELPWAGGEPWPL